MRKANAARIQIILHRTKNSRAVRRKGSFVCKNAAGAAPQAGRGAVAQQLPLPGGQGDGAGGVGGVIKDAQSAPRRAVAPDGGQHPAHQRLLQRKKLQSLRGMAVGAAQPGKGCPQRQKPPVVVHEGVVLLGAVPVQPVQGGRGAVACWVSVKQFSRNDTATALSGLVTSTWLGRGSTKSHVCTVKVLGMGLFAFQERVRLWQGVTH